MKRILIMSPLLLAGVGVLLFLAWNVQAEPDPSYNDRKAIYDDQSFILEHRAIVDEYNKKVQMVEDRRRATCKNFPDRCTDENLNPAGDSKFDLSTYLPLQ